MPVSVNKVAPSIQIVANDIVVGEKLVVKVVMPEDITNRAKVTVGGVSKLVTLKDGIGYVAFEGLNVGSYSIDVVHNGDKNYGSASASMPVKVNKSNT